MRRAVPGAQAFAAQGLDDAALAAGAAIGALDAVVRRDEKWAGAWRQRLALSAAAMTARQAGRVENEAALRDTSVFSRPGDILSGSTTLGPAGSMLLAWRRLAARPAEELLTEKSLAAVLEKFGYAPDDEVVNDLADDLRQLAAGAVMVATLTGAFIAAERHGFIHVPSLTRCARCRLPPGMATAVRGRCRTGHMKLCAGTGAESRRQPGATSRKSAKSAERLVAGRKRNEPRVPALPNAAAGAIRLIRTICRHLVGR